MLSTKVSNFTRSTPSPAIRSSISFPSFRIFAAARTPTSTPFIGSNRDIKAILGTSFSCGLAISKSFLETQLAVSTSSVAVCPSTSGTNPLPTTLTPEQFLARKVWVRRISMALRRALTFDIRPPFAALIMLVLARFDEIPRTETFPYFLEHLRARRATEDFLHPKFPGISSISEKTISWRSLLFFKSSIPVIPTLESISARSSPVDLRIGQTRCSPPRLSILAFRSLAQSGSVKKASPRCSTGMREIWRLLYNFLTLILIGCRKHLPRI